MKQTLLLAALLPLVLHAQINRSATELAKENLQQYIKQRLFPSREYEPLSWGTLTARSADHSSVAWSLGHRFLIRQMELHDGDTAWSNRNCWFVFYFDKKMNVLEADGDQLN